jgi:undecaprenyl-diphosphatase
VSAPGPLGPLEAALLGLVEGLTEYLPVSSTGHLILTSWLLGRTGDPGLHAYEIVIQSGAILAVLGLYRGRIAEMLRGLAGRDPAGRQLLANLVIGVFPALVLGVLLKKPIDRWLFHPGPVAAALAVGGLAMFACEPLRRRRVEDGVGLEQLGWSQALAIGLVQCVAMWPGTSRSLATILGGLAVGLRPPAAAEFSFLLALPTLLAATSYALVKDGAEIAASVTPLSAFVGVAVAMVSAAVAVKGFIHWLGHHGLQPFAVYRILLAAAVVFALR